MYPFILKYNISMIKEINNTPNLEYIKDNK